MYGKINLRAFEETSNLFCSIDVLAQFLDEIDGLYQGLLGHYSGKNRSELDQAVIGDAVPYHFVEFFINEFPN